MDNIRFKNYVVTENTTIKELLERRDTYKIKTFLVEDLVNSRKIVGTVSDGDIRRFALRHDEPPLLVRQVIKKDYFYIYEDDDFASKILEFDVSKGAVPILDREKNLVDIYCGSNLSTYVENNTFGAFVSIAPTRITFAGGGTDVASWFRSNDGTCINAAISKCARVHFEIRDDAVYVIKSQNTGQEWLLTKDDLHKSADKNLIFNCLKKFPSLPGLNINIQCDYAPGTGLGGSSALCVALVNGCSKILGIVLSKNELSSLSYEIERYDTEIKGGWQDQIASARGGVNVCRFSKNGMVINQLSLTPSEFDYLSNNLFLFPVGDSRSSSRIHKDLDEVRHEENFQKNMIEIQRIATQAEKLFSEGNLDGLGALMHEGWELKRKLSPSVTNEAVDYLYDKLISFGGSGGRLIGAGGSGYVLMMVPPAVQLAFIGCCENAELRWERVSFDYQGARLIGLKR